MTQIDLSTITEPQGAKIMDKLKAHTDKPDTSRAAFEKWAKAASLDIDGRESEWTGKYYYIQPHIQAMWTGWQAAITAIKHQLEGE